MLSAAQTQSAQPVRWSERPSVVSALVMASVFCAAGIIMLMLPLARPVGSDPWADSLLDASLLTVVMSPAVWWLLARPLSHALAERRRLLDRLFDAGEQERAHLARELHDEMGQQLTAIRLRLQALAHTDDPTLRRERLDELHHMAATAHSNVRRIARGLRPSTLEEFGLVAAIEHLVTDLCISDGPQLRFDHASDSTARPARDVEGALYRVCQEALTNAIQHGHPRAIQISLRRDEHHLRLTVTDDGEGFDPGVIRRDSAAQGLFGLPSMRERIRRLGGAFSIQSRLGQGTTLIATFPSNSPGRAIPS